MARNIGNMHAAKIPGAAGDFCHLVFFLPLQVDQRFEHFVGSGNDLGVRLETTLGDDHVGELVGIQFYVALHLLE